MYPLTILNHLWIFSFVVYSFLSSMFNGWSINELAYAKPYGRNGKECTPCNGPNLKASNIDKTNMDIMNITFSRWVVLLSSSPYLPTSPYPWTSLRERPLSIGNLVSASCKTTWDNRSSSKETTCLGSRGVAFKDLLSHLTPLSIESAHRLWCYLFRQSLLLSCIYQLLQ